MLTFKNTDYYIKKQFCNTGIWRGNLPTYLAGYKHNYQNNLYASLWWKQVAQRASPRHPKQQWHNYKWVLILILRQYQEHLCVRSTLTANIFQKGTFQPKDKYLQRKPRTALPSHAALKIQISCCGNCPSAVDGEARALWGNGVLFVGYKREKHNIAEVQLIPWWGSSTPKEPTLKFQKMLAVDGYDDDDDDDDTILFNWLQIRHILLKTKKNKSTFSNLYIFHITRVFLRMPQSELNIKRKEFHCLMNTEMICTDGDYMLWKLGVNQRAMRRRKFEILIICLFDFTCGDTDNTFPSLPRLCWLLTPSTFQPFH